VADPEERAGGEEGLGAVPLGGCRGERLRMKLPQKLGY